MRRLILTLALVALLALALVAPAAAAPNGPPADVTDVTDVTIFVQHVVEHAQAGGFFGVDNPGVHHHGFAGFDPEMHQ